MGITTATLAESELYGGKALEFLPESHNRGIRMNLTRQLIPDGRSINKSTTKLLLRFVQAEEPPETSAWSYSSYVVFALTEYKKWTTVEA